MAELADLFWQFMVMSLLAFGGGAVVLGLLDQVAVTDKGWITPDQFATGVGFTFITPGPILVLAPFVGYLAAGPLGAVAASLGVFSMPWLLSLLAARGLQAQLQRPSLKAFAKGGAPAVVSLFALAILTIARSAITDLGFVGIAVAAAAVMLFTKVHPVVILLGGAVLGLVLDIPAIEDALPAVEIP